MFAAEHLGNMPPLPVRRMTTVAADSLRRCSPVSGILDQHSFVGSSRHAGSMACLSLRISARGEVFTQLSHKCRVPVRRRGQLPPQ